MIERFHMRPEIEMLQEKTRKFFSREKRIYRADERWIETRETLGRERVRKKETGC